MADYPDFIASTGYGTGDGLCGWNCYHSFDPFFPGISERTYTDEQLEQMNREENTPKEYLGRQYTAYEARQHQRAMERNIRARKQKLELLKLGGADEKTVQAAEIAYRTNSHQYVLFSKAMGLPQERERINYGLKKLNKFKKNGLTNGGNGGIIKAEQDFMRKAEFYHVPIPKGQLKVYKFPEYENIFSQTYNENSRKIAEHLSSKLSTGEYGTLDRVIIARNKTLGGIAAYDYISNSLYISEELINSEQFSKMVSNDYFPARNIDEILVHELGGHKKHWDTAKKFYAENIGKYKSLEEAKIALDKNLKEYVSRQMSYEPTYILKVISRNAYNGYTSAKIRLEMHKEFNELVADAMVLKSQNDVKDKYLFDIIEEMMNL